MAGTLNVGAITDGSASATPTEIVKGISKAWVNFSGSGVVSIRSSYNVSSITDTSVGTWTINLTTAMRDTNFAIVGSGGRYGDGRLVAVQGPNFYATSTSTINVVAGSDNTALNDWLDVYASILGERP